MTAGDKAAGGSRAEPAIRRSGKYDTQNPMPEGSARAIAKGTLPIIGVTKTDHVEDAVKAANVTLTEEETANLEKVADSLEINAIRFWEKVME